MKKNSYNHDVYMQSKMSAYSPNANYGSAMKIYKIFAYVSGALLTGVYFILQIL